MKATDSGAGQDMDDFDDVRRLYRQEASRIEPPARLDDAILAASRRAVRAGPVPAGVRRGGWRWQAPLAAAAVVVLATSLTVLFFEKDGRLPERGLPPVSRAPAPETQPAHADGVPAVRDGVQPRAQVPEVADGRNSERAAQAPARRGIMEERVGPPVATESATADVAVNPSAGAPGAVPAPVPVPAAVPATVPPSAARSAPGAGVARREAEAPTGPAAAEAVAPSAVDGLAPQRRLEEIRRLWDSGQREEASRQLEAFLHDHPGFAIPTDFPVTRPPPR
jgi:hypothetical protein